MNKYCKFYLVFLVVFSFFLPVVPVEAKRNTAPGISCAIIPALTQAFLRAHVSNRKQDDDLNERTITQFIKRVDPSKTVLWQADVDQIRPIVKKFLENIRTPDCSALDTGIQKILVSRAQEQLVYAKEVLGPKYKIDESVEIALDADKRNFPKNKEESEKRQLAQIHFQISNYQLTDMKLPEAKKQLIHRYELNIKRLKELTKSDIYDFVLNAFAAALDPHSNYLSPEATEDFRINMSLSLEGIGASLSSEDGYTVIQELIPGGAASKSKLLEPKDKIIAVAQGNDSFENVIDMDLRDVVRLIRGKAGTNVRLTILRAAKEIKRFTVSLTRSKVTLEEEAAKVEFMDHKVGDKTYKLARLELPGFYGDNNRERSSYKDMVKAIQKINAAKVDGLLLDFSQNGGGLLDEAVRIGGLFIKTGNIVATKDSNKEIQKLDDDDPTVQYKGPLVVLTSRVSASAAEIVAGALQDYKRALIVGGDHTYGKGSVQAVLPLQGDYGILKVTTGLFFIPGGNSTQHRGVVSDVPFPSPFSTSDIGEQYLDNSLKPDSIPSFISESANEGTAWTPVSNAEVEKLKILSQERVNKSKDFAEIVKELKEQEDRKGTIKLAELRMKDSEKKKKDKGDKKKPLRELAKEKNKIQVNEALNILGDYVFLRQNGSGKPLANEGSKPVASKTQ